MRCAQATGPHPTHTMPSLARKREGPATFGMWQAGCSLQPTHAAMLYTQGCCGWVAANMTQQECVKHVSMLVMCASLFLLWAA